MYILIMSPSGRYYRHAKINPLPKGYKVVNHSMTSIVSIGRYGVQKRGWKPSQFQIRHYGLNKFLPNNVCSGRKGKSCMVRRLRDNVVSLENRLEL